MARTVERQHLKPVLALKARKRRGQLAKSLATLAELLGVKKNDKHLEPVLKQAKLFIQEHMKRMSFTSRSSP